MTIQQTITIPANRRVFFDVPFAPAGKVRIEVTITPEEGTDTAGISGAAADVLWGRAKALGAKLTPERFKEIQREDLERELEREERLWDIKK